jgi:hypothetical protein
MTLLVTMITSLRLRPFKRTQYGFKRPFFGRDLSEDDIVGHDDHEFALQAVEDFVFEFCGFQRLTGYEPLRFDTTRRCIRRQIDVFPKSIPPQKLSTYSESEK